MTEDGKVEVVATLRLQDGRIFRYRYEVEAKYAGSQEFLWNDGNYACDCNRAGILNREHGLELEETCSDDRIELRFLEVGGRVVYDPRSEEEVEHDWS